MFRIKYRSCQPTRVHFLITWNKTSSQVTKDQKCLGKSHLKNSTYRDLLSKPKNWIESKETAPILVPKKKLKEADKNFEEKSPKLGHWCDFIDENFVSFPGIFQKGQNRHRDEAALRKHLRKKIPPEFFFEKTNSDFNSISAAVVTHWEKHRKRE